MARPTRLPIHRPKCLLRQGSRPMGLFRRFQTPDRVQVFPSPGARKNAIRRIRCPGPRFLQGWATHPLRRWVFTRRTGPLSWRLARRTAQLHARPWPVCARRIGFRSMPSSGVKAQTPMKPRISRRNSFFVSSNATPLGRCSLRPGSFVPSSWLA